MKIKEQLLRLNPDLNKICKGCKYLNTGIFPYCTISEFDSARKEGKCVLKAKSTCDYGQDYCSEDCKFCKEQK